MARFTGNSSDPSTVRVTRSAAPESDLVSIPENALVIYYVDGQVWEETKPDINGYCEIPSSFPESGQAFTLEAHIPNYGVLTATDTVPQEIQVYETSFEMAGFRDDQGDLVAQDTNS